VRRQQGGGGKGGDWPGQVIAQERSYRCFCVQHAAGGAAACVLTCRASTPSSGNLAERRRFVKASSSCVYCSLMRSFSGALAMVRLRTGFAQGRAKVTWKSLPDRALAYRMV